MKTSRKSTNFLKSFITIILLLFLYPVGVIVMWLIAPWSKTRKWFWTFLIPVLVVIPIVLLFILVFSKQKKVGQSINKPTTTTATYTSKIYPISFQYPDNWVIGKISSSGIRGPEELPSISITDTPQVKATDKPPTCRFIIQVFKNPNKLNAEQWNNQIVDVGMKNPDDPTEKDAARLLKQSTPVNINGLSAIKVTTHYLLAHNDKVYRIDQSLNKTSCKNGYTTILDSLSFKQ